jgi:hypothetical protein
MIIQLADGRKFDTATKQVVEEAPDEYQESLPVPLPKEGVKLEDLPADTRTMNVMCAVASYKLLGINDQDICIAIGCSSQQLEDILHSDIYSEITTDITKAFVRGQENSARDVLAKNAMHAADVLVTTARKGKSESNRLRAAEGILDRMNVTGDAAHGMAGPGLVIKIVKEHKNTEINISM